MSRVARNLFGALALAALGGGLVLVVLREEAAEPERKVESIEGRRLFKFGRDEVEELTLARRPAELFRFARDASRRFQMLAPIEWPADEDAVSVAIDRMASIGKETVVVEAPTPEDLEGYGLGDTPLIRVTVRLAGGAVHELLLGEKNELAETRYFTDGSRTAVWAAKDTYSWALERDTHAYRDKRLLPLDPNTITRVSVKKGELARFQVERTDGKFYVVLPEGRVAGDVPILERLFLLLTRDLKAETTVTDTLTPEAASAMGFDRPAFVVEVGTADGRTHRVRVLEASVERNPPAALGWVEGGRVVATIYDAFPSDVDKSPDQLKDRELVAVDAESVAKLELGLFGGGKIVLERAPGADTFRMTSPETRDAKPWRAASALSFLARLRADGVVAESVTPAELKSYLLDPSPERYARLYDASGKLLADVRFGKARDDKTAFAVEMSRKRLLFVDEKRLTTALPMTAADM